MANPTRPPPSDAEQGGPDSTEEPAGTGTDLQPTPFDHPLFLPGLFAAGCAWFGYDAYLNQDPDLLEHLEFNRFGLRVIAYATAFTGYQGWCELKEREPSPWFRPAIHALFAAWFAFDGFLNADPWYVPYQEFNIQAAVGLGITAVGLTVWAARRQDRGDEPPGFLMALWVLVLAASFGYRVVQGVDNGLVFGSTAAGLGVLSVWMARRAWERRRRSAAAEAE